MTALPTLKIKAKINFPATVQGEGGISVEKANGVWTIEPDWTALNLAGSINASNQQVWVYNTVTGDYERVSLTTLIASITAPIFVQNDAPDTDETEGSIWIDADSTDADVYQLVSGVWTDTGANLKGPQGDQGNPGDISGTTGSTNNSVIRADGTGGTEVKASAVAIDDSGNITGAGTVDIGDADTTISRTGAGAIAVEGVVVALNSISLPHTASQIEVGHASDTTISRSAAGVIAVEGVDLPTNIPQNSQSAAYGLVLSDAQKHILHPVADNNARTYTIDSNTNVPYPVGTVLTFVNEINVLSIAITDDTLQLAGTASTGTRALAANGVATAIKVTSTKWYISGAGLT